jgi:hypothetical protein
MCSPEDTGSAGRKLTCLGRLADTQGTTMTSTPPDSTANVLRAHLQDSLGESYIVERELGGDGMSRVYVALGRALDRRVVVKMLGDLSGAAAGQ